MTTRTPAWRQRSVYFDASLNEKIDAWLKIHPHATVSHLVREALFFYFNAQNTPTTESPPEQQ